MAKHLGVRQRPYAILERMKGGRKAQGFTIIETLVVLAVSAGLFVAVAATLGGRQGRTEFSQSIQDIRTQIQQVANDVSAGFYPDTNNYTCTPAGTGPSFSSGSSEQGGNTGCIFLGKVIQFQIAGTSDPEQFKVYTLAGLQQDSTGAEVTTYSAARPKVVAPTTTNPGTPDASTKGVLKYGVTTKEAYYGAVKTNIGAVAFLNSLSPGTGSSSSQHINVIPVSGTVLNASAPAGAQAIENNIASSSMNVSSGVKLCFVSGGSNQSGLITIGGNGRQLSVTLKISENTTCS